MPLPEAIVSISRIRPSTLKNTDRLYAPPPVCSSSAELLRVYYNLPKHLARFHVFVRGASFFQRECPINDGFKSSRKDVAEDIVQIAHGAHVGTQKRKMAREQKPQIELGVEHRGG